MANESISAADLLSGFTTQQSAQPAAPVAAPAADPGVSQDDLLAGFTTQRQSKGSTLNIDDVFERGLIPQESGGKQFDKFGKPLTSKAGAIGAAQVMPKTAPEAAALAGLPYDDLRYRTDAEYNKTIGKAYLNKQVADFGGDLAKGLAAYNAGPGATQRAIDAAIKSGNPEGWLNFLPPETRAYVPAVINRAGGKASSSAQRSSDSWRDNFTAVTPPKERSWGDATKDTAIGVASGVVGLGKSVGDIYGLISGDMKNPVSQTGEDMQKYLQSIQSEALREKQADRQAAIDAAPTMAGKAWAAFASTVTDPALFADIAASNLASFAPGAVVGRMTANAVGARAMVAAMEAGPVSLAARQAIAKKAASLGVGSAKATMAIQQGADVASQAYEDSMKKSPDAWAMNPDFVARVNSGEDPEKVKHELALDAARATFLPAAAVSVAANSLPGTNSVEKMLVGGVARDTGKVAGKFGAPGRVLGTGVKETGGEFLEEGGGQAVANVAKQAYVDPNQDLTEKVGENAGMGAAGGFGPGLVAGVFQRPELAPVVAKAAEPNTPLSKAAVAGNTGPHVAAAVAQEQAAMGAAQQQAEQQAMQAQQEAAAAAAPPVDPLAERVSAVTATAGQKGVLDVLRAEGSPVTVKDFIKDLAIAKSASTLPAMREQALSRLEYALEWAGVKPAQAEATAEQQTVAESTGTVYDTEANKAAPAPAFEPAAQTPVSPDSVIEALKVAPHLRTAEQKLVVDRANRDYTPEQVALLNKAANSAFSMTPEDRLGLRGMNEKQAPQAPARGLQLGAAVEQNNQPVTEQAAEPAAPVEQPAAEPEAQAGEDVPTPKVAIPAGPGPAAFRQRRAQLTKIIESGLSSIEQRKDGFYLVSGNRRRQYKLNNAIDAQLARKAIKDYVDGRAHAAATSPTNDRSEPTGPQIEAVNWKKGDKIKLIGQTVVIENPEGSVRKSKPGAAKPWETKMVHHYGDIAGTTGADGDPVDAFVGPQPWLRTVYVIDQVNQDGSFDEHKVMIGFPSEEAARQGYLANYEKGWTGLGAITAMTPEQFSGWVKSPAAQKPAGTINGSVRSDQESGAGASRQPGVNQQPSSVVGGEFESVRGDAEQDGGAADSAGDSDRDSGEGSGSGIVVARMPARGTSDVTISVNGKRQTLQVSSSISEESARRAGDPRIITQQVASIIQSIARVMGKKVQFFRDANLGDGFISPDYPNTIFLNESSSISPLAVFGHELWHHVKREMPEVHAAFANVLAQRAKTSDVAKRYLDLGYAEADVEEEFNSDVAGDLFTDPTLLQEVLQEISDANPEKGKGIIAEFAAYIKKWVDSILDAVKQPGYDSASLIKDVNGIRSAFKQALAQYAKQNGVSNLEMQAAIMRAFQTSKKREANADVKQSAKRQDDGLTLEGYHFSQQPRQVLDSGTHGNGLKDANREQFQDSEDPRIRQRIYFYVDKGTGITPLPGLGSHAHRARLENVYDMNSDKLGLRKGVSLEAFESKVLDAGYDGYLNRRDGTQPGVVIMLGKRTVKPEYLGVMSSIKNGSKIPGAQAPEAKQEPIKKSLMSKELNAVEIGNIPGATMRAGILTVPAESAQEANKEMERIGSPIRFTEEAAAQSAGIKKSVIRDQSGELATLYHGTANIGGGAIDSFRAGKGLYGHGIYMSGVPARANAYARGQMPHVYPVNVDIRNPISADDFVERFGRGLLTEARSREIRQTLLDEGYDGIVDKMGEKYWEVVALNPEQISSAFSVPTADIVESKSRDATETPEFKKWFGDSKVVDEKGKPLVVYHGTKGDFSRFNKTRTGTGSTMFGTYEVERHGIFVTPITELANDFATQGERNKQAGANVMPLYARIQNPLDMTRGYTDAIFNAIEKWGNDKDLNGYRIARNLGDNWGDWMLFDEDSSQDPAFFIDMLKELGYDGVKFYEPKVAGEGASGETFVAFDPEQIKSAIGNNGNFDSSNPDITQSRSRVDPMEMSTRTPTAKETKKFSPEDSKVNLLISDFESGQQQPKWLESVSNLVTQYPNYRAAPSATTPSKTLERLVRQATDNLTWLHDQVPESIRQRSKLWYDGANAIANRMAEQHDISVPQASGILAVLSPQKDWFMNVSLAKRVADIMSNQQGATWSREMEKTTKRIFGNAKYQGDVDDIRGKSLGDLDDTYLKAMWLRVFDEAHNPRSFMIVSPEGNDLALARTKSGAEGKAAWGGIGTIAKAISIFENDDFDVINSQLGRMHKVRNFYNNILVPNSPNGHVTIDTHAVAAALLRPLSGNSIEVIHNFGGPSNAATGLKGTYALYEEAYRRAAESRGILPRELQSITWEAVRGLYVPTFKSQAKNVEEVDKIWEQYKKGRLSYENARTEALEAGGGIDAPSWAGRDPGAYEEEEQADESGDVSGDDVSGRRSRKAVSGNRSKSAGSVPALRDRRSSAAKAPSESVKRSADRGTRRDANGNLAGLPTKVSVRGIGDLEVGHWAPAEKVARDYMESAGMPYNPPSQYVKVDRARAERIAAAYEEMAHEPNDPLVKKAYAALAKEVTAQYKAIIDSGLKVEFINFEEQGDPYAASPRLATEDIRNNNHMWVFSTRDGFGSGDEFDPSSSPMLAETKYKISGQTALVNDLFRVVHDYFGHVKEGLGFRADGEENTWRAHSAMLSPLAQRALTTETRGQNSWVNFGPYGETNRTASAGETRYADQKVGLLPEWASEEGRYDEVNEEDFIPLPEIFEGLSSRGLKKEKAKEVLAVHPKAAEIKYVQDNILDILQELDDAGAIKINCD